MAKFSNFSKFNILGGASVPGPVEVVFVDQSDFVIVLRHKMAAYSASEIENDTSLVILTIVKWAQRTQELPNVSK